MIEIDAQRQNDVVWTVSQLNHQVAQMLQAQFARLWVRGEISNFTQAASGHWYFSIKDESAAVRAVMFRGRAQATGLQPKSGDKFEFRVTVSLYEPRGDYQLQVDAMRRVGRGDLHEAFLALKEKLDAEGLFAVGWSVRVSMASSPYSRTVVCISGSSVAIMMRLVFDNAACSAVRTTMGLPPMSNSGLLGKRLLADRAGIIVMKLTVF